MNLLVVPAPNSGLGTMAVTGQLERLFVHLGHYADAFDVTYMTWLNYHDEARLWAPFAAQTGARLVHASMRHRVFARADVIRCMNLHAAWPVLFARTPFVMSYGADYPALAKIHGRPVWKWKELRAMAVRRAARVLVPNRQMATDLMGLYPGKLIHHHPNWVDCERFSPGEVPTHEGFRVLYVGRLVKEKNLEALARDVAMIADARLVCVGEGPVRERLTALGAECVGPQPWTSLPHWYREADVFALPSLSEGCPKALQEAMACGRPCVVSDAVTIGGNAAVRPVTIREGLEHIRDGRAPYYGNLARVYALDHWDVQTLMPREITWLRAAAH